MSRHIHSHRAAFLAVGGLLLAFGFHGAASKAANTPTDPIAAAIASERLPGDRVEDAWRKPQDVLQFLEIAPGQHALDFYSGPGYYTELLSRVVGPTGRVIAYNNELYNQAANHELLTRLGRKRLPNTQRLNAPSNYIPLTPESLDRVLFVLVYHDLYWRPRDSPETLGDPERVLARLHSALRPGGLVVVVDHVGPATAREDAVDIASRLHRIDPQLVLEDFERAGFEFVGASDVLRHATDDYSLSVFNPKVRRRTDQFVFKFRKPNRT